MKINSLLQNGFIDLLTPKGSYLMLKDVMLFSINCWVYGFGTHFSQNVLFIGRNIFSQVMVICLSWYLHLKYVSWSFNIYKLTYGGKSVRVLSLSIWNHLFEVLKAWSSFKTFKRSLNNWFGSRFGSKFAVI